MLNTTVEQGAFNAALQIVKRAVEKRTKIPVLANCLLTADEGALAIEATDLDVQTRVVIAAETSAPGMLTLPAHRLADIVKLASKGALLNLTESEGQPRVTIAAGSSRAVLDGLIADDFPIPVGSTPIEANDAPRAARFKPATFTHAFEVDAQAFLDLLKKTSFAISTEETRYYLNGVYLHVVDGDLCTVATDGHRLGRASMPAPDGARKGLDDIAVPGIIIPRRCVLGIEKLLAKQKGALHVRASARTIEFAASNWTVTSKTIDGTFPDYARAIPRMNEKRLTVDTAPFADLVKRVSAMASDRGKAFKITLQGSRLFASVNNLDAGATRDDIACDYDGPEGFEIGFNSDYVLSILGAIGDETVRFAFADPGAPALVSPLASANNFAVLMPMRV